MQCDKTPIAHYRYAFCCKSQLDTFHRANGNVGSQLFINFLAFITTRQPEVLARFAAEFAPYFILSAAEQTRRHPIFLSFGSVDEFQHFQFETRVNSVNILKAFYNEFRAPMYEMLAETYVLTGSAPPQQQSVIDQAFIDRLRPADFTRLSFRFLVEDAVEA